MSSKTTFYISLQMVKISYWSKVKSDVKTSSENGMNSYSFLDSASIVHIRSYDHSLKMTGLPDKNIIFSKH